MAEKAPHTNPETLLNSTEVEKSKERAVKTPEKTQERLPTKNVEQLRKQAEAEATKTKELIDQAIENKQQENEAQPTYTNNSLRKHSFNNTMRSVRRNLNPLEKSLSKIIHQPAVDQISEVAAKSIGRPSGIIGGSLLSLVVSTFALITAKRSGFELRPSIFIVLFMAGFAIGVLLEFALWAAKKARN